MRRGIAAALLLAAAAMAKAGAADREAEADSLLVLYEEAGYAPGDGEPLTEASSSSVVRRVRVDSGATPSARWFRLDAERGAWRLGIGHRVGRDAVRTDLSLSAEGDHVGVGTGRLALRGGAGLLLGGTGRSASPAAGQGLRGGRSGWRAVGGEPSAGSLRGTGLVLRGGPCEVFAVAGEADRDGRLGGGGRTRQALLRIGGRRARASVALLSEEAGEGVGLGVAVDGPRLDGVAELALWRPSPDAPPRRAWGATVGLGGRHLRGEAQLAVREPGFAPRPGRRPAVLGADDRWGGALRVRGHVAGAAIAALTARSRGERRIDGFPAAAEIRRFELVAAGRGADGTAWRARVADRAETVRGWAGRAPWLPAAEISTRRTTRISLRADGRAGPYAWRAAAGATGVSRRLADGDDSRGWRRRVVLRLDRELGGGASLRLNQVWAWGDDVDLVSVEVPVPGLLRPRHWGHRDRERSLGLDWRGRGWRLSVAAAAWDGPDGASGTEVLARLTRRP